MLQRRTAAADTLLQRPFDHAAVPRQSPAQEYPAISTDAHVLQLVRDYPLAAVTGVCAQVGVPAYLPLIARTAPGGDRIETLIGHMARRNVAPQALEGAHPVGALFTGPDGYVSANLLTDRSWIPTWNYARVFVAGQLRFSPELTQESLDVLVEAMERDQARPWSMAEAGDRVAGLKAHIIGFTINDLTITPGFKLGQEETDTVFGEIVSGHADPDLVGWMRRMSRR